MNHTLAFCLLCLLSTGLSSFMSPIRFHSEGAVIIEQTIHQQASSSKQAVVLDVLFATNEDCDLYINDEWKGLVSKQDFLYLKMAPGLYTYRAKSKATGDELKERFSVLPEKQNEVFMDLLYTIDEKAELKRLAAARAAATQPAITQPKMQANATAKPTTSLSNKEKEQSTVRSIVANMVLVSKGNFVMGNNRAPSADEVEHPVTVSPFYFSKYEVTQEQWEAIMGGNPSVHQQCGTCPVENVTWEEATRFTLKLSAISDKKFRLPTEAEWEYVTRMGGRAEVENAGGQEAYVKKTAWFFSNSNGKTNPVGKRAPNVLGIYDLMGNVSEWCQDWYGTYYYKEEYSQKDPDGPPLGKEKVVRGGNFKDFIGDRFRPSFRNKRKPMEKGGEIGLRLVMEAD